MVMINNNGHTTEVLSHRRDEPFIHVYGDGRHPKPSLFLALSSDGLPTSTYRTCLDCRDYLGMDYRKALFIFRFVELDSFQSKDVIEQRGGHGWHSLGLVALGEHLLVPLFFN